jgi:hypothetical protein
MAIVMTSFQRMASRAIAADARRSTRRRARGVDILVIPALFRVMAPGDARAYDARGTCSQIEQP